MQWLVGAGGRAVGRQAKRGITSCPVEGGGGGGLGAGPLVVVGWWVRSTASASLRAERAAHFSSHHSFSFRT